MRKLLTVLLALLPQLCGQIARTPNEDRDRIPSLENACNQAAHQKDIPALKMLLGAELIYVDFDGTLMDKTAYLASADSGMLHPRRS